MQANVTVDPVWTNAKQVLDDIATFAALSAADQSRLLLLELTQRATAVAQPVAPPPPTFMTVPVPMGVFPGMTVVVQAPTGQRLAVIVPQGVGPGGVFKVPIPAPPPPQIRYY